MAQKKKAQSSLRNVLVLISGASTAQVILLAASPILTRLYTPADFGVLALFVALIQIFTMVASGRYEIGILLPEEQSDAISIALLASYVALGVNLVVLVLAYVFNARISDALGAPEIGPWLYLVPIAAFFGAIFNIAQYLNLRQKTYGMIARATIYKSVGLTGIQLGLGAMGAGAGGLILGRTASNVFANWRLLKTGLAGVSLRKVMSQRRVGVMAIDHRQYPMFSMPAGLINVLNTNVMNFALPILFSTTTLGFYSLTMRVLGAPLTQISGPIGQVFQREAAQELSETGQASAAFYRTLIKLFLVSAVIFGVIWLIVVDLFTFVFGRDWAVAGEYAQIMLPLFAARFVVSPLSNLAQLTNARYSLGINVVLLSVSCIVLWISFAEAFAIETMLRLLSLALAGCYFAYLPVLGHLAARGTSHE